MFWRSQKEDVAHEISLPEQVECLEVLPFTPVEAHYYWQQVLILSLYWYKSTNIDAEYLVYRRQHQECAQAVKEMLASMKMNGVATLDDCGASLKLLQQVLTQPLCSS